MRRSSDNCILQEKSFASSKLIESDNLLAKMQIVLCLVLYAWPSTGGGTEVKIPQKFYKFVKKFICIKNKDGIKIRVPKFRLGIEIYAFLRFAFYSEEQPKRSKLI